MVLQASLTKVKVACGSVGAKERFGSASLAGQLLGRPHVKRFMESSPSGVLRALDATRPIGLGVHAGVPRSVSASALQGQGKGSTRASVSACDEGVTVQNSGFASNGASSGAEEKVDDGLLAGGFESLEDMLEKYLPEEELGEARRLLHGLNQGKPVGAMPLREGAIEAKEMLREEGLDLDVKAFQFEAAEEELREPRKVIMGVIQNSVDVPTTEPFRVQKQALIDKIEKMINLAGESGVQVCCLQEAWNMPFAFCTREKKWSQFAEDVETGESMVKIKELARKWNMVIVSPILERDTKKCDQVWNTAVVVGHTGNIVGKHRKNHIPRVNDFNESTYYMEGDTGHPVFDTKYAKIGVNICYGRHHTLNWMGFGLNGAEIVFNPSATVGALSEPMWAIEGRNAAINNSYFVGAINRVGTETFPNEFTSGDSKPAHKDFGHFYGSSYFAGPDASRTPPLARSKDGLIIAECDLNLIQQVRDQWGIQMTGRHDMYAELLTRYAQNDFEPQIVRDPHS
eukprot:CAMPEP_0197499546 /NCGR_PEP_ID=MMETSP1311-20131121/61072_1 /TAXON_ID=464262 /ORGANISM="Genus nov. species nov., Strain RCC856" /LENGTH=513 /DNA_ID=CAMNT_0043045291 /DNA_START=184 /DNA_END=1725 /DNA_ORIENTATION=-